eukprot:COSAG06_NODE_43495_length_371_cov_1.224265_1_plen_34_part_10
MAPLSGLLRSRRLCGLLFRRFESGRRGRPLLRFA